MLNKRTVVIILTLMIFVLINPNIAFSLSISSCKSGSTNWECDVNKICTCRTSGSCSNGNLLVYDNNVDGMICIPRIRSSRAEIDWNVCEPLGDEVYVRADCDQGQSSEKTIFLLGVRLTTTTTTTTAVSCPYSCQATCNDDNDPPFCYRRYLHGTTGCTGGMICCESVQVSCPPTQPRTTTTTLRRCPYECCINMIGYENKYCYGGLTCCDDHTCKRSCAPGPVINIPHNILFWVAVASILPIIIFFLYIWRKDYKANIPEF